MVVDVQAQGALSEQGLLDVAEGVRFPEGGSLAFVLDRVPDGFQATGEYDSVRATGDGTRFAIPRPRGLTVTWNYRVGAPRHGPVPVSDILWITAIQAPPRASMSWSLRRARSRSASRP